MSKLSFNKSTNAKVTAGSSPTAAPTSKPKTADDSAPFIVGAEDVVEDVEEPETVDEAPEAVEPELETEPESEDERRRKEAHDKERRNIAEQAVREVDERFRRNNLFDVFDGRVSIKLGDAQLATFKSAWLRYNNDHKSELTFSAYLAWRMTQCATHDAVRPLYIDDAVRQGIETEFNDTVTSGQDLLNRIKRAIRPIIQNSDGGVLTLNPVDPALLEMLTGWFPDKTPAQALADWMSESALIRAGLGD